MKILRIVLFIFLVELSFAWHEYGHLVEFQKLGVQVEEFSLGIGPKIYSKEMKDGFVLNLRLVPIFAYVKPTDSGHEFFQKNSNLQQKLVVHSSGIRNNLLISLVILFFWQLLGWIAGNLSGTELLKTMILTPFKLGMRFVSFVVSCFTWGHVNWAEKYLVSTGGLQLPRTIGLILTFNLSLFVFNLAPVYPFDGGKIMVDLLEKTPIYSYVSEISPWFLVVIALFYFISASRKKTDYRFLENEPQLAKRREEDVDETFR